jgi:hypothetical protein
MRNRRENIEQMNKKETDTKKEAAPVMKRLARPMLKDELTRVTGAGTSPSNDGFGGSQHGGDIDFQN